MKITIGTMKADYIHHRSIGASLRGAFRADCPLKKKMDYTNVIHDIGSGTKTHLCVLEKG